MTDRPDRANQRAPGPSAPVGEDSGPRLEIIEMHWERVQLVLSARVPAGADGIDPAELVLRRVPGVADVDDARLAMSPTRVREAEDVLTIRWNVMAGPGQMPLDPGRWRLEVSGSPIRVSGGSPEPGTVAARFAYARGEIVVVPTIGSGDGALWLDVGLAQTDPGSRPVAPRRSGPGQRIRRLWNRQRRRIFRTLYAIARRVTRRTGRRILFASDSRAELGGNLKVVWDRMIDRGLDRDYRLLKLFRPSITDRRSLRDRIRMPWLLATADVILIDDYMPVIYGIDDPGVRIIQLWHASGAFKTVGYSRVGKAGGPSPFSRIHKNYSYAIVSSDHDVPFYAEAFGIPESRVVPTGIPRMDRFFDSEARARGREAALAAFPMSRGRTAILFAPTFRGGTRTASYDTGRIDYEALHALATEKDAVVIFKMHPFVREPLRIPDALRDRLVDATASPVDVNDLLFVVDLLITDYSSIVFEFSTLGRPMLFFAYDLEEYVADRDFYVPFEEFVPGRIVRTFDALLDAIRREDYELEKVHAFAARHFDHLDGSSTDRVIDELVIAR
ncbi:MAG: CDP-glycerol glycerophosphotransferase family protein [Chloroflexota bacterium]|nr:CDP-glycerol glycerophosphotransferase family protein [Chloroflexota bacterium]